MKAIRRKDRTAKAVPAPKQIIRTAIPDSMDGIRFEIARMSKYVEDGHKDPAVIATAQKIAQLAVGTARQLKKFTDETRELSWLQGIHAWCHANFEPVSNPAGAEVIKTPARMFRELEIPEALAKAVWEPIRDSMAKAAGKNPSKLKLPKPMITGGPAVAVCLVLSLVAAVGITPMKMRFGGYDRTITYVWGSAFIGDKWHDVDVLLPKFGEHREFPYYEDVEIPL